MRTEKEVGRLTDYGDHVNEAYRTYASVYLDLNDDNPDKFIRRDMDIAPLRELEDRGENTDDEEVVAKEYLNHSFDIVSIRISRIWKSLDAVYEQYPMLKELAADMKIAWEKSEKEKTA